MSDDGTLATPAVIQVDRLGLRLGQRFDRKGKVISPGTPIFNNVSLEIRSGEPIGLVGRVGSGKTSFLRLLNRLIEPTQGQLFYQGQPYDRIPPLQLRRQILYVAQQPKLLQPTGREALVYALQLHGLATKPRLDYWIDRMELSETLLNQSELELSPGQKQWIALTRALALETPVLLFDEPTQSLDLKQRNHLRTIIQEISKTTTLVISSQDLDWLPSICSSALIINDRHLSPSVDWPAAIEQLHSSKPTPDDEWD